VCVEKEETEEGVASYRDFHFTFKFTGMDSDEESMFDKSSPSTYVHEVGNALGIYTIEKLSHKKTFQTQCVLKVPTKSIEGNCKPLNVLSDP
jgi:hypothetical protein